MPAFQEASVEHIRRLNRLIDKGGVQRLRRLYDQAQAELDRKISRVVGRGSSPFTAQQHRTLQAHVRHGQMVIAQRMGVASSQATVETQTDALHTMIKNIKRMEKRHGTGASVTLPIEEAAKFQGVVDKRRTSLLKQNKTSMANYGAGVVKKVEQQMALSLATGETTAEAVERVATTADVEFWRAERIVRTEQAWAYSATQRDAIAEVSEEMGGLYMRWTELVDDYTRRPLDDRVGADSVALHGQVALPGETFKMPPNAKGVSDSLLGEEWEHPPNRPNDRATIMPWHPTWEGPPGWRLVGGRKVDVKPTRRRGGLFG